MSEPETHVLRCIGGPYDEQTFPAPVERDYVDIPLPDALAEKAIAAGEPEGAFARYVISSLASDEKVLRYAADLA